MKLEVSAEIPFPRERVFEVYREHLVDLVKYLPNIRAIEQVSRKDEGGVTQIVNHWRGGADIPAVARAFVSDKLLEWDDYASWNNAAWTCDWKTVVGAVKDAVRAEGKTFYEPVGANATRVAIRGVIEVDAKKVPGVPRLLAGTVGPAVEVFLVGSIKPNLVSVAEGVRRYLEAQK